MSLKLTDNVERRHALSLQIKINQIVPPEWCSKCDVCCRFPEKDSFLAPYFTHDEIQSAFAYASGTEYNSVPNFTPEIHPFNKGGMGGFEGGKIILTPFKEAYICPAFNPATSHCRIYDIRPLDCVIYPFAIMWSADGRVIVLGLDMKCPYIAELINSGNLSAAETEMRNTMDSSPVLDIISENPGLVGPFQDDVAHAVVLTNLTKALAGSAPYNPSEV